RRDKWEVLYQEVLREGSQYNIATPESILSWIQKYRRPTNNVPPKLISTYGKDFKFLCRKETKERLWNGTLDKNGVKKRYYALLNNIKDRNFHPIPFIAARPGTGKTRVLEESLNMLQQCAENDSDSDLKKLVNNAVLINVTYGNGSAASITDSNIGGEISLPLRILYRYFVEGVPDLEFVTFTITLDINKEKVMIINCIDEVNNLYELENSTFETMVKAVGSSCCSMHPPLPIPLPLSGMDHMLEIGRSLQFPVYTNHHFHRCLGDVGGHCRTLEFFYQRCSNYIVNTIDFLQVMTDVHVLLKERYAFEEFAQDNSDIIAGCLLDEVMILYERIKELRQYGIVILEENHSNGM
ncbi:2819_t:CDS:2, partial [Funneliformis caledonium]